MHRGGRFVRPLVDEVHRTVTSHHPPAPSMVTGFVNHASRWTGSNRCSHQLCNRATSSLWTICQPIRSPRQASTEAHGLSFSTCRPTVPTSARSKTPPPSSRRSCEWSLREPSTRSRRPRPMRFSSSNRTNVQISSHAPGVAWTKGYNWDWGAHEQSIEPAYDDRFGAPAAATYTP